MSQGERLARLEAASTIIAKTTSFTDYSIDKIRQCHNFTISTSGRLGVSLEEQLIGREI